MRHLLTLSVLISVVFAIPNLLLADDDVKPDELFTQLDKNKDGKVTADEVSEKQKKFFERLLRVGDTDKNKSLSKSEFVKALDPDDETIPPTRELSGNRGGRRPQGNPEEFFKRLDRNKDGKVTRDELPEQARQRLGKLFDQLGKDELTKEDFAKLRDRFGPNQKRPNQKRPKQSGDGDAAKRAEQYFSKLDTNGDGNLSVSEAPEKGKGIVEQMLKRAGKGPRDALTKAEFMKLAARGGGRPDRSKQTDRPKPGGGRNGFGGPLIFRKLDFNQDGKITRAELARAAELFDELDSDKSGSLDPRELFGSPPGGGRPGDRPNIAIRPQRPDGTDGKKSDRKRPNTGNRPDGGRGTDFVKRVLQQADKNGDGKISKDEAPARMKERFSRMDANGDGFVDRDELTRVFSSIRQGQSKKKK